MVALAWSHHLACWGQVPAAYLHAYLFVDAPAGRDPPKAVRDKFTKWLARVKSMSHTAEMYEHEPGYGEAFLTYQRVLHSSNAVDFDDILVLVCLPCMSA